MLFRIARVAWIGLLAAACSAGEPSAADGGAAGDDSGTPSSGGADGGNAAGGAGARAGAGAGSSATGGRAGSAEAGSGTAGSAGAGAGGSVAPSSNTGACQDLPAATGAILELTPDDADALPQVARDAPAGTTLLLADGTYTMTGTDEGSRRIQIVNEGVSLRSKSGSREAVVIDGEYLTEEIITISASRVTLADLTLSHAVNHPVHVMGGAQADIAETLLHNLHIIDGGEQFVKVNTSGGTPNRYADRGVLECSLLELTEAGRPHIEPNPGGCYTGGIDAHQARGWQVRDNVFRGIYCTSGGLAEHAIHFWTSSRDTLVERNTIIDCARGIGFGLGDGGGAVPDRAYADDPYPGVGYVGHYDGIVRNNVIAISPGLAEFDTGIELEQARGTRVLHNSVIHPTTAFASISHRFANTQVVLENNLVRSIRARDGSQAEGSSNLENAEDDLFVDVAGHDLHLAPGAAAAIDQGVALPDAGDDIDGMPHEADAPDLGADELGTR